MLTSLTYVSLLRYMPSSLLISAVLTLSTSITRYSSVFSRLNCSCPADSSSALEQADCDSPAKVREMVLRVSDGVYSWLCIFLSSAVLRIK